MRVLLDHDVPARLRHDFRSPFVVETTRYRGWQRYENGDLLDRASKDYDALITLDGGIPFQQHLPQRDLRVVILKARSQARAAYRALIPGIVAALEALAPGRHTFVIDERRVAGLDLPEAQTVIVVRPESQQLLRTTTPLSDDLLQS